MRNDGESERSIKLRLKSEAALCAHPVSKYLLVYIKIKKMYAIYNLIASRSEAGLLKYIISFSGKLRIFPSWRRRAKAHVDTMYTL